MNEAPPEPNKLVKDQGLELASPGAYPSVPRTECGGSIRIPDSSESDLLEGRLRVMPDLLNRASNRTPEVLGYRFQRVWGR